jgi:hypothetical protein
MALEGMKMLKQKLAKLTTSAAAVTMLAGPALSHAQSWEYINPIPAGTSLQVRTTETIDSQTMDGRIYRGTIENDVRDTQGRLAIPSGATAELVVRRDVDNDLVLDLDSVTVNGRRYGVDATSNKVGGGVDIRNSGIGANKETARNVGGGALLGAILGAAIGGGDGAAAGAAAGAAVGAGAQILTKGRRVNVPAETLLSYRLQSDMNLDIRDSGYDRDGNHYHKYDPN